MSPSKQHTIIFRNQFLLKKTWRYFSGLGTPYSDRLNQMRSHVLSNQMNFVLFGTMLILLLITVIINSILHITLEMGTLRVAAMLIISFINLILANFRFHRLSKYSLIFLTPVIFILGPILLGYVEEEGYTYNPYVLIAGSIIPQLLLSIEKEKYIYWIAMFYYLLLVIFTDPLMMRFQKIDFPIVERIRSFYPFYKISQVGVFVFVNLCIYHLRIVMFRFEDRLNEKNHILDIQNRELKIQRERITEQKNLIEEKSRSIFESIQYASRIQTAVLKPIDFLSEWGLENFILHKPAAVVSGDFYWGRKIDNRIVVSAVDCTGHGVPGAFMSMLGLAFLDDIFDAGTFRDAADVLDLLRENVIKRLRQKGDHFEPRDGMDLSLCIIDQKKGEMHFAGAMNPIYLVRDGVLAKLAADPMPIGYFMLVQKPFKNNVIEIRKGDKLYLFSDGYTDQFGGEKRKRFMIKPFQDLLLRIHDMPMETQKEVLTDTFLKWKGANDQVDDVLVIGISL